MSKATAIVKARVFDGTRLRDWTSVRFADGIITDCATGPTAQDGDEVIDAEGGTILPGLIDSHIHLVPGALLPKVFRSRQFRRFQFAEQIADICESHLNSPDARGTVRRLGGIVARQRRGLEVQLAKLADKFLETQPCPPHWVGWKDDHIRVWRCVHNWGAP